MQVSSVSMSMRLTSLSARDHLFGHLGVAVDQSIDRLGDLALDQPAHLEKRRSQASKLLLIAQIGVQGCG